MKLSRNGRPGTRPTVHLTANSPAAYNRPMHRSPARTLAYCALATLLALYLVGAVSNGVLRHIVQTVPLWLPIWLGWRKRESAKWAAIPCFAIWLLLMALIWLFLLGWVKVMSGHFTPIEIGLTLVIGAATTVGLISALRWRTGIGWTQGIATALLSAVLQLAALRLSFLPSIEKDR